MFARILAIQIVFSPLVVGPGFAQDRGPRYQRPQDILDPAVIQQAEEDLEAGDPDYAALVQVLRSEISKYTSQFVDSKRIQDERRNRSSWTELDKNSVRLLVLAREAKTGKIQFLGNEPYLYRLHRALGRAYQALEQPYRALGEYAMALRYTGREQPWKEPENTKQSETRYLFMLRDFADPDRIAQETDGNIRQAALRFREQMESYSRLKREALAARKNISVVEAQRERGQDVSVADAQERAASLGAELETVLTELEEIRRNQYRSYHAAKIARDGNLAYQMALLVRQIEEGNKKLSRILNRSSFYRGIGTAQSEERTALRNFVGYGIFLNLAHRIDPQNLLYLSLLAREYRNSRENTRAIAFEEMYIREARKQTNPPPELAEHLLSLGGLFTDTRNYVRARETYEQYLAISADPEKKARVQLHLADIYFEKTGNFNLAEETYNAYLTWSAALPAATDFRIANERRAISYRIYRSLASIKRRNLRTDQEQDYLARAREVYGELQGEHERYLEEKRAVQTRISNVKRQLLSQEDERAQQEYYRLLRIDLPAVSERVGVLETRLDALNIARVLERLALLAQGRRDFERALALYREIIEKGSGSESTRARRNIQRINRSLVDGRLRKPILPPDFER